MKGCTREDRKILSLVATGKTNKEIARELDNTLSSVTTRLQQIDKRWRVSRRSEAARYFVQTEKDLVH